MINKLTLAALAAAMTATTAGASVRYVAPGGSGDGSSWSNAMGNLQDAIDASSAGDQVWVAAGTYAPERLIKSTQPTSKAFFLKDGVSLYGGFAGTESSLDQRAKGEKAYDMTNATILSADDDVPDVWVRQIDPGSTYRMSWQLESNNVTGTKNNSTHLLYFASTLTSPVIVDGFTLTGANANVPTAKPSGAAVYAAGDITIRNCRIVENSTYFNAESTRGSDSYGGAVYLKGGKLEDSYIARTYCHSSYGNGFGGGLYAENSTVVRCDFEDCVGLDGGGGAYLVGGSLSDCTFRNCYGSEGGSIYNEGANIKNVTIFGSRGLKGGAIYNVSGPVLNVLAGGCYADAPEFGDEFGGKGGALYIKNGDVAGLCAYNCTSFNGGGVYFEGADGRLINSTINNCSSRAADANANIFGSTATNTLNCIVGAQEMDNFVMPTTFAGFPSTDAERATVEAADWSLAPGSGFIDSGTAVEGFTSGNDLAGNPRVSGSGIDCGAYEFVASERIPTIILTFAPGTQAARIGTGGASGYEFTIDWGDGVEESYNSQAYYSHLITGNTVKIYGDDIVVLNASSQNIVSADISRATKMIQIQLMNNGMTSLNLGNHPAMTGLYANNNSLTSLNVSGCPAMRVLDVHENNIAGTIDCSAMNFLSKIDIADNKFTAVTLPKHSTLYDVDLSRNLLTEVDATGLSGVDSFAASENQITSIDLDGMASATEIYLDGNQLTTLNLSGLSSLEKIMAAENQIASIDLSVCPTLTGVYLQDNNLSELTLTANPGIRWLNVGNNHIGSLDVSAQKNLSIFIANNNNLSSCNLTANTSLSSLDLSGNNISSIDVSKASYLSQCHLENNALTALDVTKNAYLYGLFCSNNSISTLDLSKNTYLQRLEAYGNSLTALDITNNTGLQEILIQSNQLDNDALAAVINALPDVSNVNVTPETESFIRQLNISFMPGTAAADIAAAEAKGWFVTADYDAEPEVTITSLNLQINRMGDEVAEVYNAAIEYANDQKTTIRITNFMDSQSNLIATLDADGNVKIAPQVCGGDDLGNYYMIVNEENVTGNPMEIYATNVTGHFDGTTLTLDPWNLIIVPVTFNENLGTAYPQCLTSEFVMSNATMDYTLTSGITLEQNVFATLNDNSTIDIYGWGGYGVASISRNEASVWTVDADRTACFVGGLNYFVTTPEGSAVNSTSIADSRTLTFGAWQLATGARAKTLRNATAATVHFNFDLPTGPVGIESTLAGAEVVGTVYRNAAGLTSTEPFDGFNIVTTTYDNGTTVTRRVMIRR